MHDNVQAMVAASQITIAECHGTGTALGDPIEVGALRGVMEPRDTPLLTTSAKSNIGHTEACAGMIGLIKCVSMVSRSTADPNCHLNSLNPHLDVEGFPSVFETESVETRLNSNYAGVSSFGFSGTNARADVWSQCKSGPRKAGGSRSAGGAWVTVNSATDRAAGQFPVGHFQGGSSAYALPCHARPHRSKNWRTGHRILQEAQRIQGPPTPCTGQ